MKIHEKLAVMLVDLLGDGPEGDEKRLDQASELLSWWSDAKGLLVGGVAEVVNLKYNDQIRPLWYLEGISDD